jgi:hypothetical protein
MKRYKEEILRLIIEGSITLGLAIIILGGFYLLCYISGCGLLPVQQNPHNNPVVPSLPPVNTIIQTVTKTDWMYPICVFMIIGGIAAFVMGQGIGIRIAIIGVTGVTVLLTLAKYSTLLPVLGLTLVIGLVILQIYQHRRALIEIVKGIQDYKNEGTVIGSLDLGKSTKELINKFLVKQSNSTKKIVAKVKEKLNATKTI